MKKTYEAPEVLAHQPIAFETGISGGGGCNFTDFTSFTGSTHSTHSSDSTGNCEPTDW